MDNDKIGSDAWSCKTQENGLSCMSDSGKQVVMGDDHNGDHVTVGNTRSKINFRQDKAKTAEFDLDTSRNGTFDCKIEQKAGVVGVHCENEEGREVNLTNAGVLAAQNSNGSVEIKQRGDGKATVMADNVDVSEYRGPSHQIDARFNNRR